MCCLLIQEQGGSSPSIAICQDVIGWVRLRGSNPGSEKARMPVTSQKHLVHLSPDRCLELEAICRHRSVAAAKVRRARILLMSDNDHPDGRRTPGEMAESVGISE